MIRKTNPQITHSRNSRPTLNLSWCGAEQAKAQENMTVVGVGEEDQVSVVERVLREVALYAPIARIVFDICRRSECDPIARSYTQVAMEFVRFSKTGVLNVREVLTTINALTNGSIHLDDKGCNALQRVLVYTALHLLLGAPNLVSAVPEARKVLFQSERIASESPNVTELRSCAYIFLADCVRVGLRSGKKEMEKKAAQFEHECPINVLIDDLYNAARVIVLNMDKSSEKNRPINGPKSLPAPTPTATVAPTGVPLTKCETPTTIPTSTLAPVPVPVSAVVPVTVPAPAPASTAPVSNESTHPQVHSHIQPPEQFARAKICCQSPPIPIPQRVSPTSESRSPRPAKDNDRSERSERSTRDSPIRRKRRRSISPSPRARYEPIPRKPKNATPTLTPTMPSWYSRS